MMLVIVRKSSSTEVLTTIYLIGENFWASEKDGVGCFRALAE